MTDKKISALDAGLKSGYSPRSGLRIADELCALVEGAILPGTGVSAADFWDGLARLVQQFAPQNRELLDRRTALQTQIDRAWPAIPTRDFLEEIGYLVPEGSDFRIGIPEADPEIAGAGPQLVVPVSNARFALNAANARWGSLYDALYGSDALPESGGCERGRAYNPKRGAQVVAAAADFLDQAAPLARGSYRDLREYVLIAGPEDNVAPGFRLAGEPACVSLARPEQFAGYRDDGETRVLLLRNNGLHIELRFDPGSAVGRSHPAGLADITLEAALTSIQDCEDSVAAVDATEKVAVYRHWLDLMRGELSARFRKGGRLIERCLNPDREYSAPDGGVLRISGRSLMFVRNVGLHMYTDAALDEAGENIPEGMLDALVTTACALHDLRGPGAGVNSCSGRVYIVKPKLHGPAEAAFAGEIFREVERILGLPAATILVGLMDEERRTSVNLKECVRALRDRIVFINTGFLDRTGDELYTNLRAGVAPTKAELKCADWLFAYEDNSVDVGLSCGFAGRAQIGKGMWAKPDEMRAMLDTKAEHPRAGASCAWVPSPTAAVLHAMHYHEIDVPAVQDARVAGTRSDARDYVDRLLRPAVRQNAPTPATIQRELENNLQGILGYVVRWVDQGIGCSKVPDRDGVGLMEDRATLRIASQHLANWLYHDVVTEDQVRETARRMARLVDEQNAGDPAYRPMGDEPDASVAYRAALELALHGRREASGYTERILAAARRQAKAEENVR